LNTAEGTIVLCEASAGARISRSNPRAASIPTTLFGAVLATVQATEVAQA